MIVNDLGSSASGEGNDESVARSVVDEINAAGGEALAFFETWVPATTCRQWSTRHSTDGDASTFW
ncbi:hypothetical protein ACU686_16495 [Yinghuangia aomiensis]